LIRFGAAFCLVRETNVMAGLVPAIYVFLAVAEVRRGCPDKPGHDELRDSAVYWRLFQQVFRA
jgi:hypothetical protein